MILIQLVLKNLSFDLEAKYILRNATRSYF